MPARATVGARTTADEPQYLLTALSLWEDRDLDIGDELAAERYRDFHEVALPVQTEPLEDGRVLSPHDPLLPLLLAIPVGVGGWAGAKLALAALAGVLAAALVWIAAERLAVPIRTAALVVAAFGVVSPLVAYGTQIYPELPAALAVTGAVGALLGPLDRRGRAVLAVAVIALPWLGVKYVAVAAALAAVGLVRLVRRGDRAPAVRAALVLAFAGVAYVVVHRVLYGGWTVYAAGDHFVGGEVTVVGHDPDHLGRSRRLIGLLLDRGFGLAAWAPAWLLAVPAVAAAGEAPVGARPRRSSRRSRRAGRPRPGSRSRCTAGGGRAGSSSSCCRASCCASRRGWRTREPARVLRAGLAAVTAAAVATWAWLLVEVVQRDRTLIVDFEQTRAPLYRAWRNVLPDYHRTSATTWVLTALWLVALAVAARAGWRSAASTEPVTTPAASVPTRREIHVPA